MRRALLRSLVAAMGLAAGSGVVAATGERPVTYAVLRGDGILVPIGTRTGGRWRAHWPEPARTTNVPLSLDDLPRRWWGEAGPTRTWYAWLVDGTRMTAAAERPAWYPTYCRRGIGLQTSVVGRRPLPAPGTSPYPKMGLAASAPTAFARIEVVDDRAEVRAPLRTRLDTVFVDAEGRLRRDGARGRSPARAGTAPAGSVAAATSQHGTGQRSQIERLYRAPLGPGRFIYYFEAVRRYPDAPAPSSALEAAFAQGRCFGMVFASGWFVSDGAAIPERMTIDVKAVPCSYDGARTMLPLGYVADGDTTWWFAQLAERHRESYVVVRVTAGRPNPEIVLAARGGSCSPPPRPDRGDPEAIDAPERLLEGVVEW